MDIEKMLATILEELQDFKRMTNARFDTMETEFAVMKMDMGTLKSDMITVKSDIDTVKGDIDTVKGDIDTVKGDIDSIRGDMAAMEMRLGKKIDAAAEDTRSLEVITAKNWRDICALKTLAQS